jgi:hypothetical protein
MLLPPAPGLFMATNHWSVSMGSTICPVRAQRGTISLCFLASTSRPCASRSATIFLRASKRSRPGRPRARFVDLRVEREHADHRQAVALAHRVVVGVVGRRDLDHAGAEFAVDVGVGDHRDRPVAQRQLHALADEVTCSVRPRGAPSPRCRPAWSRGAWWPPPARRCRRKRVADVPQEAVFLLAFDLEVGHGGLQHRVPADQALAAVDQAFVEQAHEGLGHHLDSLSSMVKYSRPQSTLSPMRRIWRVMVAPELAFQSHTWATKFLRPRSWRTGPVLQLALDDDLRGDAGVVGARHPQRVVAAHAVVAGQRVHDGLVERVAHVQRARHVGRRQLDGRTRASPGPAWARTGPGRPTPAPSGLRWRRVRRTWQLGVMSKAQSARGLALVARPQGWKDRRGWCRL